MILNTDCTSQGEPLDCIWILQLIQHLGCECLLRFEIRIYI